jgi:enoyl-CoA hydratase/carnithine racemase
MTDYETVLLETTDDHVATVTLNRPNSLNAFNIQMKREIKSIWERVRDDNGVHAVVLRAAPGAAFCAGTDVREATAEPSNVWNASEASDYLCPKFNACWKPIVAAVHGMAAGGAFYFLNECDIVICSDDATFFDPHVTYGMTAALEPIGMTYRMGLGDVLRMALLGNDERIGAQSALRMGIVSEVTTREDLWPRAHDLASRIAAKPTVATQGTVKAIWESLDLPRSAALRTAFKYCQVGNPIGIPAVDRTAVMAETKTFEVR